MLYMQTMAGKTIITDGSRLVIEAMARAGADSFIGYPITPANLVIPVRKPAIPT
jgi:2-oxoglutarate/2-oxoacid ferredoxin oxidoreductase subunit alpha